MPHPLAGARLKWNRAKSQFETLDAELMAFKGSDDKPYRLELQHHVETGEDSLHIHIVRETPPMWSVQIGEIVHNLRSALDHMVYEIAAGNNHGRVPSGTEFPIFIDEGRFRSTKRGGGLYKIRGLPAQAIASIEEIQPFQREQAPDRHRLWVLQELSNWDKHRLLHLTSVVTGARNFSIDPGPGASIEVLQVRDDGEVEDGAELLRFKATGETDFHVDVRGEIIYDIAFDKTGPAGGSILSKGLQDLISVVEQVGGRLSNLP